MYTMTKEQRLKVLFLSKRFLFPMDTGAKIRTGKMLEQLSKKFDVTLVSSVSSPQDDPYVDEIQKLCSHFYAVPWTEVPKYSYKFYAQTLLRLFSRYPISVLNDRDRHIQSQITEILKKEVFDLLICDFVQSSLNFSPFHDHPTLLFQHNVEAVIARRHYDMTSQPLMKAFWWLQYAKMHKHEKRMCQQFDGVVAVSEIDQHYMEDHYQAESVWTIPTGIDTEYFTPFAPENESEDGPSLIFTGSMDWLPNEDAILFFAQQILGKVKQVVPRLKVWVVGRNPSRHFLQQLESYPEIVVTGWVDDIRPYISQSMVYIVPLRIGGGTRIKLYEAMAMGKAVVSTGIGAEGLPVVHGEHVVVADEADAFADAVVHLLKNADARRRLEVAARDFVQSHCSWEKAADVFAHISRKVAMQGHYETLP